MSTKTSSEYMPQSHKPATYYAPPGRDTPSNVESLSRIVQESPLFQAILDSVDGYLMILNHQRQVLAMNHKLIEDLKVENIFCLIGNRPGEILGCIHSTEGPGGCGTSKACATCGAVISIVMSQKEGKPVMQECLATVKHQEKTESLEFSVRSTPVIVNGIQFTILVFHDISGEKRKEALERTFFHDILNTLTGLMGWSSLLEGSPSTDTKEIADRIVILSRRLQQEIEDQRGLTLAENGALEVNKQFVPVDYLFDELQSVFDANPITKDKKIEISYPEVKENIITDETLLMRVLINMVKNAFEASAPGETVNICYEKINNTGRFSIRNPGVIPNEVALQLFKRSFSTKSPKGRGIGTYSMKLFGERYLGGKVGFQSTPETGTVFYIELPTGIE